MNWSTQSWHCWVDRWPATAARWIPLQNVGGLGPVAVQQAAVDRRHRRRGDVGEAGDRQRAVEQPRRVVHGVVLLQRPARSADADGAADHPVGLDDVLLHQRERLAADERVAVHAERRQRRGGDHVAARELVGEPVDRRKDAVGADVVRRPAEDHVRHAAPLVVAGPAALAEGVREPVVPVRRFEARATPALERIVEHRDAGDAAVDRAAVEPDDERHTLPRRRLRRVDVARVARVGVGELLELAAVLRPEVPLLLRPRTAVLVDRIAEPGALGLAVERGLVRARHDWPPDRVVADGQARDAVAPALSAHLHGDLAETLAQLRHQPAAHARPHEREVAAGLRALAAVDADPVAGQQPAHLDQHVAVRDRSGQGRDRHELDLALLQRRGGLERERIGAQRVRRRSSDERHYRTSQREPEPPHAADPSPGAHGRAAVTIAA